MTPEGRVKKKVKALLGKYPLLWQHWPVQTGFGAPTLDCTGCYCGMFFAIETKAPGEKLTPRQELTKRDMVRAGGEVFVIGEHELENGDYSGMAELERWLDGVGIPLA